MDPSELLEEVRGALGVGELQPLRAGGQKWVFSSVLEEAGCVVKVVPVPLGAQAEVVLERARREVELLAIVESEFVVRVLTEAVEVGDRPEVVCWAEEQLDGADLGDLTDTFPWEPDTVFSMIGDIAAGLSACHDLDVVHRDLSPGNVRRRGNGRFALMDPGFARHLSRTALTGVYQPGTPGFCSPEHVPGGHPTPASDVFGLGILAFYALTGRQPIPYTGDEGEYWDALRNSTAPLVRSIRADVPEDLASVVDRCLQRQAARRYLDAGELLSDPLVGPGRFT